MANRDKNVFLAKVADQAERYDEMVQLMKEIAEMGVTLTYEERDLLSVAYKNAIGSRRAAWRVNSSLLQREELEDRQKLLEEYRSKIEKEISELCTDALNVLDKVIATAETDEFRIYFHKMKGDYNRYIAEVAQGDLRKSATDNGLAAYQKATDLVHANKDLTPVNPIVLGLALNFSVFYYEIMKQPQEAISLAKKAFDNAIMELDTMNEEDEVYKDATQIMSLLRDNLNIWESETGQAD